MNAGIVGAAVTTTKLADKAWVVKVDGTQVMTDSVPKGEPATARQRWALFTLTKTDYRSIAITKAEASELIGRLRGEKEQARLGTETLFGEVYSKANAVGLVALAACKPTPMVVQKHTNMLDDTSKVEKQWYVEGGVCGFAWVKIRPATTAFAKWLIAHDLGRHDDYQGGVTIWADGGGQSMERKMAYCHAFAEVINAHPELKVEALTYNRLD